MHTYEQHTSTRACPQAKLDLIANYLIVARFQGIRFLKMGDLTLVANILHFNFHRCMWYGRWGVLS